jgi:hypothetical protein
MKTIAKIAFALALVSTVACGALGNRGRGGTAPTDKPRPVDTAEIETGAPQHR